MRTAFGLGHFRNNLLEGYLCLRGNISTSRGQSNMKRVFREMYSFYSIRYEQFVFLVFPPYFDEFLPAAASINDTNLFPFHISTLHKHFQVFEIQPQSLNRIPFVLLIPLDPVTKWIYVNFMMRCNYYTLHAHYACLVKRA